MRVPRRPIVLALATFLLGLRAASADDPAPKKEGDSKAAKAAKKAEETIAWRPQWVEAVEEAAERNILVMLHSHAST